MVTLLEKPQDFEKLVLAASDDDIDQIIEKLPAQHKAALASLVEQQKDLQVIQTNTKEGFRTFLKYVVAEDPGSATGFRKFQLWPYLLKMADELVENRLLAWLKARQIGATTLLAAFLRWKCYQPGSVMPIYSQGELEAQKFLKKIKVVDMNLPAFLALERPKGRAGVDSMSKLEFANGSLIEAMPSTERAGRSITGAVVVFDEADFHEYLEENFEAAKPLINDLQYKVEVDENGQETFKVKNDKFVPLPQREQRKFIMISTSNPKTITSKFKETFLAAPENNFKRIFHGWDVRPGRTEEWLEGVKAESDDAALFEKEYPKTAEQALAPTKADSVFDREALEHMRTLTAPALLTIDPINVYVKRVAGAKYGAASDPSHGTGGDFAVSGVVDFRTMTVVADIMRDDLGTQDLAFETIRMLEMYGNPIWGIEDNDWGKDTISAANAQNYRRLYKRKSKGGKQDGWHTDGHSRWLMWTELVSLVKAGSLRIFNKEGLEQFFTVIKTGNDRKPEAMKGAHDDYPTMCAIAYQMRHDAFQSIGDNGVPVQLPSYF
jgi:hypothetical protein